MTRSHTRLDGQTWAQRVSRRSPDSPGNRRWAGRSAGSGDDRGAARRWAVPVVAALSLMACSPTTSPAVQASPPGPGVSASAGTDPTTQAQTPANAPLIIDVSVTPGTGKAPTSGDATLTVVSTPAGGASDAAIAEAASDGNSGQIVTATIPDAGPEPLVRLVVDAQPGSSLVMAGDGTGAVVSPSGALVAGFTAPVVVDAAGTPLPASWQPPEAGDPSGLAVDLVADPPAAAYPLTVTVHLGTTVVAGTEWGNREGGESLAVTPSAWGRVSGQTGVAFGWADVVRREPAADTPVMEKQFRCHQLGAPDKATWNLEPWRPDVSYLDYLLARCNPA